MREWMASALLILAAAPAVAAQNDPIVFEVRHDHDPWGGCRGQLIFSQQGLRYETSKEKHARDWSWADIQSFDRISPERFTVLTWEDRLRRLGHDRPFDFRVLPGAEPLTEEAFRLVESKLDRPLVDRLVDPEPAEYEVAVRHRHTLGGCEGTLYFTAGEVIFESEQPRHNRRWRRGRDLHSFWSAHPYHLDAHVFEENRGGFEKVRRFEFELKRPLDAAYYSRLRRQLWHGHPARDPDPEQP